MPLNLADQIVDAFATHGAMSDDELRSELAGAGHAHSAEAIADALHDDAQFSTISCLVDGRHTLRRRLLGGGFSHIG